MSPKSSLETYKQAQHVLNISIPDLFPSLLANVNFLSSPQILDDGNAELKFPGVKRNRQSKLYPHPIPNISPLPSPDK